ncbi:hypothetical protein DEU38_1255 [Rhodococcus sp. AG1013]|nr:hypothetical protein DEU38_1255 [Rhodococcus sp. AG1013]
MFESSLTYSSDLVGVGSVSLVNSITQYLLALFT